MRTDAKIGFAIGGVLLAVLTVYAIVVPKHSKKPANTTVTLVTPTSPAATAGASGSAITPPPSLGAADTGATLPVLPVTPVAPVKDQTASILPAPGTNTLMDGSGTQTAQLFHPATPGGDITKTDKTSHLDNGVYTPTEPRRMTTAVARGDTLKPLPDDVETPADTHYTVYTVKPGQTLSKIAYEVYGNSRFWVAIQRENKTLDPKHIKPGMKINLPDISPVQPGAEVVSDERVVDPIVTPASKPRTVSSPVAAAGTYIVKSGDSLYGIAKRLLGSGRRSDALYELNKGAIGPDKSRLKLGMVLKLPEAAVHTASAQ